MKVHGRDFTPPPNYGADKRILRQT
jgi:hypothetical protein